MKKQSYLNKYAEAFNYEYLETESTNSLIYVKENDKGLFVIEKLKESKYVNFYHQKKIKTFKESDLILGVINQIPVAWEAENDRER